jgi:TorA maturation chaperone TorD
LTLRLTQYYSGPEQENGGFGLSMGDPRLDEANGAVERVPNSNSEYLGQADEVDVARAGEYALLARLLARAPDAVSLARIAKLRGDATPLGVAHAALAQAAAGASADKIAREFFDLFIGVGRGELLPYGSYYLTGFLNERPLARLREDLQALGIERVEGQHEPEDHAAILCEVMAGLVGGQLPAPVERQRPIFEKHLAPWIGRFFADLAVADAADFYRHVGTVGRLFIEIETAAFALPG